MITSVDERQKALQDFSIRYAKRWKNYFSLEGLIPGINPTNEQKQVVQSNEKQLLIRGSAGSGKSLMLAYRLIKIMEQAGSPQRILYVTFNETLIQDTVKRLLQSKKFIKLREKHYVNLTTYHDLVKHILMKESGYKDIKKIRMNQASISDHESTITARITSLLAQVQNSDEFRRKEKLFKTHTPKFLQEEFFWMKANGLITLEKYMKKERTGRGHSPQVQLKQRPTIFYLFEKYNDFMRTNFRVPQLDMEDYALHLLNELNINKKASFKYDHILVDEFQDLQPMQILSLVKLTKNTITLVGDEKQRIYKRSPISYKEMDLKVNRRTNQKLSKNFRSTKQIMNLASSIQFIDVENVREDGQDFFREGSKPQVKYYANKNNLSKKLIQEIKSIQNKDSEKTIAVIHRDNENEANRDGSYKRYLEREFDLVSIYNYGKKFDYNKTKKPIFFTTPYEIKGLEFDYVFILHFDRFHYPLQERIENLNKKYGGEKWTDPNYINDYDNVYNDEKKLLYVACSRAKEGLYLYYTAQKQQRISTFVRDFNIYDYESNFNKQQYK